MFHGEKMLQLNYLGPCIPSSIKRELMPIQVESSMNTGTEIRPGKLLMDHDASLPAPPEGAVRAHVESILASTPFHSSKRCKQFLEYVCSRRLSGDVDSLKERTIAIEVFGRRPQSDLAEDTIVRVTARELRKRLAQFYATPEGMLGDIRVELPIGTYTPQFHYAHPAPSGEASTVAGHYESEMSRGTAVRDRKSVV